MNQKNFQGHFGYLSHRSISTKANNNSPSSGNMLQTSFEKIEKESGNSKHKNGDNDQITLIHKQNSILKQENRVLKRELNYYRAENILQNHSKQTNNQVNDLRETIKKQTGEIKDLKTRLQMLSKQCKMYEDIIDKMQQKINKLLQHNDNLQDELMKYKGSSEKHDGIFSSEATLKSEQRQFSSPKLEVLSERISEIMKQFNELELKVQNDNKQWERWKQQWNREKSYYLHRIHDLEAMMGINNDTVDYSKNKKRF